MNQYCKDEMDRCRAMEKILVEFVKKNGGYIDTDNSNNSAINIIAFDEFEEKYKEYYVRAVRVVDEHIELQLVKPFPIEPEDENWYALLGGEIMINAAVYSLCEILPEYRKIKSVFREEYDKFVKENGHEPLYASVVIKYNDDGNTFGGFIKLSCDDDKDDDLIFYYVSGVADLESLTEQGSEDFTVLPDHVEYLDKLY